MKKKLFIFGVFVVAILAIVAILILISNGNKSKVDTSNNRYESFAVEESLARETEVETVDEEEETISTEEDVDWDTMLETTKSPEEESIADETILIDETVPTVIDSEVDLTGINLTLDDVNGIIYGWGTEFGIPQDKIRFKGIKDIGENYEITFDDSENNDYTIIVTHDNYLVKVIKPQ